MCSSDLPSLRSLVDLKLMDFCSEKGSEIVKNAEVIFFNNFGPWFEPLVSTFHEQVKNKSPEVDLNTWDIIMIYTYVCLPIYLSIIL